MKKTSVIYAAAESSAKGALELQAAVPGSEVSVAADLRSIEAALSSGGCDLIVSHLSLPGFEAPALLHARNLVAPAVPVIIVAPEIPCEKCQELVRMGANAVAPSGSAEVLAGFVRVALSGSGRRSAAEAEEKRMSSLGRLAGCLAHDFNNILGAIEGYATLSLRRLTEEDPLREDLGEIRKAVARASAINRQLLLFSRVFSPQQKPVDAARLLAGLKEAFAPLAGPGVSMELEVPKDLPSASGDIAELGQALLNLALNASDAMTAGGVVRVKAEAVSAGNDADSCLKISVSDSGRGIPAGQLGSIFEPFFTTKPKGKGIGLGLSAVYGIVRRHNGWIDVRTSSSGSIFSVFLPAWTGHSAPAPAASAPASAVECRSGTLLIVEDDLALLSVSAKALEAAGYKALQAASLSAAKDILGRRGGEIKCILADIMLPDGRSIDAADELLRLAPGACLIFISGYDQPEEIRTILANRGFRFVQKPYSTEALISVVSTSVKI